MKKNKLNIKFLLIITSLLYFNICFAEIYDEYKNELHSNRLALKDNSIWIVASKGLVKYDKTLETISSASLELGVNSNIKYLTIATAPDNSLWFASEDEGIKKYNGTISSYRALYQTSEAVLMGFIYSFSFDSSERVFAGEMDYIFYVDNLTPIDENASCKQMYQFGPRSGSIGGRPLMDMAFDSQDNLWMIFDNRKAYYKDGDYDLASLVKKSKVDLDSKLQSIYIYPHSQFDAKPILEFDEINATSLVIDNEDNIWFTSEEGIHYYNQETTKDSIINKASHSAIPNEHFYINEKDYKGNIWFSSSTTLMKYNGAEFTTYTCDGYEEARAILCDEDIVWVLLKSDKLLKFQNNEFETIDLSPVVTGIKESITEENNTKAYVSNGVLYIENAEGINSVTVYDAMGRSLTPNPSPVERGATNAQISLPTTLKGMVMVKINDEVVKVICE